MLTVCPLNTQLPEISAQEAASVVVVVVTGAPVTIVVVVVVAACGTVVVDRGFLINKEPLVVPLVVSYILRNH